MIFSQTQLGFSVEKNTIEAFKTDIKAPKYIYLIAGLHGDEVEGIFLVQKIYEWLSVDHQVQDLPLILIPIANPDGYLRQSKENAHGIDLNSNFPLDKEDLKNTEKKFLTEPETHSLDKILKKYRPSLVINFMSQNPMLTFEGKAQEVVTFISKLNSYPTKLEKIINRGTLCHYVWSFYQAPVINFFTPRLQEDLQLSDIWQHNKTCFQKLFNSLLLSQLH